MHILVKRWHCAGQTHVRIGLYANGLRTCLGSVVIAVKGTPVATSRPHCWRVW